MARIERRVSSRRARRVAAIPEHLLAAADHKASQALNADSAHGTYKIDAFSRDLPSFPLHELRSRISSIAVISAYAARIDLALLPKQHKNIKELIERLKRATAIIDPAMAHISVKEWCTDSTNNIECLLLAIDDDLSSFKDHFDRLIKAHDRTRPKPNVDPLPTDMIGQLLLLWRQGSGGWPKISDKSRFTLFLSAAWRDLALPEPRDRSGKRTPLDDYLRDRAKVVLRRLKVMDAHKKRAIGVRKYQIKNP
jgi:hypothetical protein